MQFNQNDQSKLMKDEFINERKKASENIRNF